MKKKRIIIIVLAIIIILGGFGYFLKGNGNLEVEAYKAAKGSIKSYVEETATIQSDNQRVIYAKVIGEVSRLNVDVGDKVSIGDTLVEMYDKETDLQVKSLEAKLEALNATYKEATKAPDKETIGEAQSNIRTIEVQVQEAQRNADNSKTLYEQGAISKEVYQNALDNLKVKQEALQVAKNKLTTLQKGVSDNIKNQYEAQISDLQYQIDILRNNQQDYSIKSPVNGTLLETYVKEGAYLQPGMPVLEVGNEGNLYLELDVLASEAIDIKEGAEVNIFSEDLNIDNIKGAVRKIHPKAFNKVSDLGIEQKRVKVEVDILDSVEDFKVGYEVSAKIVTAQNENVILIPDNALFDYEDGDYVFVVDDNVVALRKVDIGIEGEDMVEVISGLSEGDSVITSPDDSIEEGMSVITKVSEGQ